MTAILQMPEAGEGLSLVGVRHVHPALSEQVRGAVEAGHIWRLDVAHSAVSPDGAERFIARWVVDGSWARPGATGGVEVLVEARVESRRLSTGWEHRVTPVVEVRSMTLHGEAMLAWTEPATTHHSSLDDTDHRQGAVTRAAHEVGRLVLAEDPTWLRAVAGRHVHSLAAAAAWTPDAIAPEPHPATSRRGRFMRG